MLDFLQHIDWGHHDGVNIGMLNDFMRNQFYDRAIRDTVKDKRCIDVGFGTGFLSVLSLKHGARNVVAYENDDHRYELGQEIIRRLGLENKITLLHERYDYSLLSEHPDVEVLVTETVNGNLWWEGMFNNVPAEPSAVTYVPGHYYLNVYAVPVPESFAQGLLTDVNGPINELYPGVDIEVDFVNCVNQLIAITNECEFTPRPKHNIEPGLYAIDNKNNSPWGWIPYLRLTHNQTPDAWYSLNVAEAAVTAKVNDQEPQTKPFDFRASRISLEIDTALWKNQCVILIPRVGLRSGEHNLFLDTGHWGPTESPMLLVKPQHPLIVTHSLRSGALKYQYRDYHE